MKLIKECVELFLKGGDGSGTEVRHHSIYTSKEPLFQDGIES